MDKTKPNRSTLCLGTLCVLTILLSPSLAVNQLVSLQGRVLQSGSPASSGNLAVTIWSNQTGGSVLYSDNFANAVSDGFFDLMLGASSELNLTYGTLYYLDLYVDGDDINWTSPQGATVNRIEFQSRNGQIPPAQVQFNAINSSHIQNDAVTASKIAPNSINASHILDNIITAAKIVNDAITSAKIGPSAVNSSHLNSTGTYYMGRLGIGTTGPSADLEIKSSSSVGALNITNGTGSPVFFVNASSQNVGIGTTAPKAPFSVYSSLVTSGQSPASSGTTPVNPMGRFSNNQDLAVDIGGQSSSPFGIWFQVVAPSFLGAYYPLLLNPNGGNVGIGTASPDAKLDVSGGAIRVTGSSAPSSGTGLELHWDGSQSVINSMIRSPLGYKPLYIQGADIRLRVNGTAGIGMEINTGGNVAIGTTSFGGKLHIAHTGTVLSLDRTGSDGYFIDFQRDGVTKGQISVSGETVSYNAFTGSHYAATEDETIERGMLVTLTGRNGRLHDDPKSEIVYGVTKSTLPNDSGILGAYLGLSDPTKPAGRDNPHLVAAVGNGALWVVDAGTDIRSGDYLVSSGIPGHAMREPGTYRTANVVARAAEPVNWESVNATVINGVKHKLISVTFVNFVINNDDGGASDSALSKAVEELAAENAELKELVCQDHPDAEMCRK